MPGEEWDLTSTISPYLDRHMVFPLLEFVDGLIATGKISYDSKDVAAARLELLQPTHMIDYAIDIHKKDGSSVPKDLLDRKASVMKEMEDLKQLCAPLLSLAAAEKTKLVAARQWNLAHLAGLGITEDVVSAYRRLARFQFDCGDYAASREMIINYIALFANPPTERDDLDDYDHDTQHNNHNNNPDAGKPFMYYLNAVESTEMLQVLWGRLACDILVQDWEAAMIAMDVVKNGLEALASDGKLSPIQALQQRTWLLHWSLFVFWNHKPDRLVDFVLSEKYKQAVTTLVPHLLRYLTAAVLLCKRRLAQTPSDSRKLLKNLVYIMQDADYSDPIVEFVKALIIDYDFELAQTKLAECESVLATDFFLKNQSTLFMEEARVFVFENYCRIHNKIDLKTISTRLGMDSATAEKWIVDLIRKANMDAVIDGDCVVMGDQSPSTIYEYVMDKSRDWNVRSETLVQNLQNVVADARKEKAKRQQLEREADY